MRHPPDHHLWRIGELAARTGVTPETIRYYERCGLLQPARRTASGYRLYSDRERRRLLFIRRARRLGCSLAEIRDLLRLAETSACQPLRQRVVEILQRRIAECQARLAELQQLHADLERRYHAAVRAQEEAVCRCPDFPTDCACLPVGLDELAPQPPDAPAGRQGATGAVAPLSPATGR